MHHEASRVVPQTVDLPAKGVALGGVKDVHGPKARKVNTDRAAGANKDLTTSQDDRRGSRRVVVDYIMESTVVQLLILLPRLRFLVTVASTATRPHPARRATRTSLAPRPSCTRS